MSEEIIKSFLAEYLTQDARSTRKPLFFVIRDASWICSEDGSGDESVMGCPTERTVYFRNDDCEDEHDDLAELTNHLVEGEECREEDVESYIEDNFTETRLILIWQQRLMFLTETDAEQHLEANHYHYSQYAHTYVDAVWRAPKLEKFMDALITHFGINSPGGDVCKSCSYGNGNCKLNNCCYSKKGIS